MPEGARTESWMRIRRKVDFLKMYETKSHFLAVHGPSESSLKLPQDARLLSNKLKKRGLIYGSKKECEKVTRVTPGMRRSMSSLVERNQDAG